MELVVDGRRVFAATGGRPFDASLPAVVFIHGAGMDHTVWQLQARYFAHHGRSVLVLDLPGHGRSEGPALGSVGAAADWLLGVLDGVAVESAALVGHSMGALVVLETAARAPARIERAALLGAAARLAVHPGLLAAARSGERLANELITAWGYGRSAHLGGHRAPGLWMLGGGLALLEGEPAGALAADLAACDAYQGALEAAARVRCPVLLLLGRADRMTPPKAAEPLAAGLRDCRMVVLDHAGHMMMIERPDETLDALRAFL